MAFWRRFLQRDETDSLAACTALDVGTEFAKALVFDIDDEGRGTVRGVGRRRQGLTHMQAERTITWESGLPNVDIRPSSTTARSRCKKRRRWPASAPARSSSASPVSWSRGRR
jgi:hypothetical protein